MLAEREPVYKQADVIVNTELRSQREVIAQVRHQFKETSGRAES
jgi:shikimate kinase